MKSEAQYNNKTVIVGLEGYEITSYTLIKDDEGTITHGNIVSFVEIPIRKYIVDMLLSGDSKYSGKINITQSSVTVTVDNIVKYNSLFSTNDIIY